MISQVSLTALLIIVFLLLGLFFVLKKFSLPSSFYENQKKREKRLKSKIGRESTDNKESPSDENGGSPADEEVQEEQS